MSSSANEAIHGIAIRVCDLILFARHLPAGYDSLSQAKLAGRMVSELMQVHGPNVKAIPPILLSCAVALHTCIEDGRGITRAPDWESIGYDDQRIMQHPMHKKAIVWMANMDAVKDVNKVKVSRDGINWQVMLHQHEHEVGTSPSDQPLTQVEMCVEGTLIDVSSVPPIPASTEAAINSMEGRLAMLERRLAEFNDAVGLLRQQFDATRQQAVSPHTPETDNCWRSMMFNLSDMEASL
ncbi:hypothetical protein BDR05DRAFT_999702 [Suillus weaverae]|nr:hypothetical protein BDR05DRAFT_999702 [Suillus weaverae]